MNVHAPAVQERVDEARPTVVHAAHEAVQAVAVEVAVTLIEAAVPVAVVPVSDRSGLDIDEVGLQQGLVA